MAAIEVTLWLQQNINRPLKNQTSSSSSEVPEKNQTASSWRLLTALNDNDNDTDNDKDTITIMSWRSLTALNDDSVMAIADRSQ